MDAIKSINLAVSFFVELGALVAFAYWGFKSVRNPLLGYVLAIGVALLGITAWGIWGAPKSKYHLSGAAYQAFGAVFFGLAAAALYFSGQSGWALLFIVIVIINRVLMVVWKQEGAISSE